MSSTRSVDFAPRMVDAHCHIETMDEPEKILAEAGKRHMAVITSPETIPELKRALSLRERFPFLFITAGFSASGRGDMAAMDEHIALIAAHRQDIVGIGEVGLDHYWVKKAGERARLKEVFSRFIDLSLELALPLVVHCRDAYGDVFDALERHAPKKVMLHCFSGNGADLDRALRTGYCISLATNVCYRANLAVHARRTPLEMMVLETDAPFLHPGGTRETNVPWNIAFSAAFIAARKGITPEDVIAATAENARLFFNVR